MNGADINDADKSKEQLILELKEARKRISDFEKSEFNAKDYEKILKASENLVPFEDDSVTSLDGEILEQDLSKIMDINRLQSLMDIFTELTGMVTAILDIKGNVMEATGWQDICTKYHRIHPETAKHCVESDLFLAKSLKIGEFVSYKCKNGLWDVVTPLYIGDKHFGNIYTGQFFFEDEEVDESFFKNQAEKYDFNQDEYLAALKRVPRFSREKVEKSMDFLVKLTKFISHLSYTNIKLSRTIAEKEAFEKSLSESEIKLKVILNGSPIPQFVIDENHRIIHWNRALEKYSGIKESEVIGTNQQWRAFYSEERPCLADLIVEKDTDQVKEFYADKYRYSNLNGSFEVTDFFPDILGGRWLDFTAATILDDEGKVIGALESLKDVTERKNTEEALQKSQELLRQTGKIAKIGGWDFDPVTLKVTWTEEVSHIYELDHNLETNLEVVLKFYPDESRSKLETALKEAIEHGKPYDLELEIITAKNNHKWVRTIAKPIIENGNVVNVIGSFQDITERKKIEMALKVNEQKYEALYSSMGEGLALHHIIYNSKGYPIDYIITDINPSYEIITGIKKEDVVGKKASKIYGTIEPPYMDIYSRVADTQEPYVFETYFPPMEKHFNISVFSPKKGQFGTVFQDITEKKLAEEELKTYRNHLEEQVKDRTEMLKEKTDELEKANVKLQELDKLKSMFIASMSHEFRTPLNSIIGFTGIILQGMVGDISDEQKKQLQMVKNSANHLLGLINDVIDISKIESDKIDLYIEELDLADIIMELKDSFKESADKKGLNLEVHIPKSIMISGDERRIKQVIMNLMSNAIKFTEDGDIELRVEKRDDLVKISVIDTGMGIKNDDMSKLFEAFSRIHVEGMPAQEGTGLGLYLSKKLAHMMGGDITAFSEFGKGSIFTFILPLKVE